MFQEIHRVRQTPGAGSRRWFVDGTTELIVWYGEAGNFEGFQFCYGDQGRQNALTWKAQGGFSHTRVDAGSDSPWANRSPVLGTVQEFSVQCVRQAFETSAPGLEPDLRQRVATVLEQLREAH